MKKERKTGEERDEIIVTASYCNNKTDFVVEMGTPAV
jgi:hypothetical protein